MKKYNNFSKISVGTLIFTLLLSTCVLAETKSLTVTVSGNGLLKVAPDIAYLNVGVRTANIDAEKASKENVEITDKIVESLFQSGIDKKDMKTQNYYVYPNFDYSQPGGENKITGYEVTNSLNITIRNIDDVGKIIDECISKGASMINGLNYSVETPSVYYGQLFQRAVADAEKKASSISNALGVKITSIQSISEGGYMNTVPAYMNIGMDTGAGMAAAKQAASTYTAPGDIELTASVVILYNCE